MQIQYRRLFSSMYLQWFCVRYTQTRSVRCKTTNDTTTPHPILNLLIDVVFCLFFFFIFFPGFTKLFHCHLVPFCCTVLSDCPSLDHLLQLNFPATTFHVFHRCQGDGFREAFEACDDGNAVSGDGCSEAWIFLKLWRKLYWIARIEDWKQIKKKHFFCILYITSVWILLCTSWVQMRLQSGTVVTKVWEERWDSQLFFSRNVYLHIISNALNFPWVWSSV